MSMIRRVKAPKFMLEYRRNDDTAGDSWMSIERAARGKIESCGGDISATGKKEGLPRRGWRGDTDKG